MVETVYYPVTYRAPIIRRAIAVFHLIILLLLAAFGRAQLDSSSSKTIWIIVTTGIFILLIGKINESSSYITLYPDRIEKKSWVRTKIFWRHDAEGFWINSSGEILLVRKYNISGFFSIPAGTKRDATWDDWLRDLPNMNRQSKNKEKTLLPRLYALVSASWHLYPHVFHS